MLQKINGIILILHSLLPLIFFGCVAILVLVFWTNLETELSDIQVAYNIIKNRIDKSSKQFRQILVNTSAHIQAAADESGLNELATAVRNAQARLGDLCRDESIASAWSPLPFYRSSHDTPDNVARIGFETTPLAVRSAETSPGFYDSNFSQTSLTVTPAVSRRFNAEIPFSDRAKDVRRKIEKARRDIDAEVEKIKKDAEEKLADIEQEAKKLSGQAVVAVNTAVKNARTEADEFFKTVGRKTDELIKLLELEIARVDDDINKLSQQGCEVVVKPVKAIFTPLLKSAVKPIEHITMAIEELERLKFLQKEIQFFQKESGKMYGKLMMILVELSAFIKRLMYLLGAVIVWIVLYKLSGRVDDFKQGWRMLTT